ncbi:hypothetical protein [Cellulomonas sp.]|uniref:hypothetical protein n=1 Tax=Cellulomonas sp. TaxID=40001 RepID=UPI003BAB5574
MLIFRQGPGFELADVYDQPTKVDLWKIQQRAPQQVVINPPAITGRGATLAWLSEIDVPELIVWGGGGRIPAIPTAAQRTFRTIQLDGRLAAPLVTAELHQLTSLDVGADAVDGALAAVPFLRDLQLSRVGEGSLEPLAGCRELRTVGLEIARGLSVDEFDLTCSEPPAHLEALGIGGAGICSLAGIEAFPMLKHLEVEPKVRSRPDHRIDLRPLLGCPLLEWVVIDQNGRLEHAEVLDELAHLTNFVAQRDRIDPVPRPRTGLNMQ